MMSQAEVAELLVEHFPRYLRIKEIMNMLGKKQRIITENLKRLRRRSEVEFIILQDPLKPGQWITSYRIRGEKTDGIEQ